MSFSNITTWGGWGWRYFSQPQTNHASAGIAPASPSSRGNKKLFNRLRQRDFSWPWLRWRKKQDQQPVQVGKDEGADVDGTINDNAEHAQFSSHIERRIAKQLQLQPEQQQNLQHFLAGIEAIWLEWQQRRLIDQAELLALLAAPRLNRDKTMALVRQRTRMIDERAAELIMAFAEFSDGLDDRQRHRLLNWVDGLRPRPQRRWWRWLRFRPRLPRFWQRSR